MGIEAQAGAPRAAGETLLEVEGLTKRFPMDSGFSALIRRPRFVHAVSDVSFRIGKGETYGLVGESGSGKTTVGRMIMQLAAPSAGRVLFNGAPLLGRARPERRASRRAIQMVFQDPYSSLNPRLRVGGILAESLSILGRVPPAGRAARVTELLGQVGLNPEDAYKFPHEFSGGQRQRVGLARALALEPELIVCDEPVSALDVSVQAQVLNVMKDVQAATGVGYLFISHDMSVVRHMSDTVGVLYLGHLVEEGPASAIFSAPRHPYTAALLSAVPQIAGGPARERVVLTGEMPSPENPPRGCVFSTRCPSVMPICHTTPPARVRVSAESWAACHLLTGDREAAGHPDMTDRPATSSKG